MSERAKFSFDFNSFMTNRESAAELTQSRYNLTIGLTLAWGFLINFVLVRALQPRILEMMLYGTGGGMIVFLIAYFVLVMVGSSMVRSYSAVKCFIGYNLIALPVGVLVAMATAMYDPGIVTRAALSTAIVTLVMMIVATAMPSVFQRMAGGLSVALLATIVVEALGSIFFRSVYTITDWVVVGIMCMYIGYDWVRANSVQRTTTNAIAAASALYLDIINIFVRLLSILARSRSDRRD